MPNSCPSPRTLAWYSLDPILDACVAVYTGTLFTDGDRVAKRIRDDIAPKVAADGNAPARIFDAARVDETLRAIPAGSPPF